MTQSTGPQTQLEAYLRTNGIRRSRSRDVVFDLLIQAGDHIDLAELISRARRRRIGQATVYRALRVFQQAGLVNRVQGGAGQVSYEVSEEHHDHMICTGCGRVIEFHSDRIEELQERIAAEHSFRILSHRHEIFGLCARCDSTRKGKK